MADDVKFCPNCGKASNDASLGESNPYAPPKYSVASFAVIENSDLRAAARQQLRGAWGTMAVACLIYALIMIPLTFLFSEFSPFADPTLDKISTIIWYILSGPLSLGFVGLLLKRVREQEIFVKDAFSGFKRFGASLLLAFFEGLFTALWTLLLVVPGIIKSLGYSMAFFIMSDDPHVKPLEALRKSQLMMRGYKAKLLELQLSFIGWGILATLTVGIGFLWLVPYYGVSMANFYENVKQNQKILLAA